MANVAKHSGINAIFTDTPKCTKGMNLHVNIVGKIFQAKQLFRPISHMQVKILSSAVFVKNYSVIPKLLRNT
jgi:hypothetical protein